MKVKNRQCIRRLSLAQFNASKSRNIIAIVAIILTTVLFTSLFTVYMSLNKNFEQYSFRQSGGYCHGSFKEVNEEKIQKFMSHPKVKQGGVRTTIGYSNDKPFENEGAEISYMDENCTKWSYSTPTQGRLPVAEDEIIMDTMALSLLGVEPKLGEKIEITYLLMTEYSEKTKVTDTFTLVGFWEYDELLPVHFLSVSKAYVEKQEELYKDKADIAFRTDLNVMLASSINIEEVMQSIETDLGYQWENIKDDNCVRIGVNWGYTSSQVNAKMDIEVVVAIVAFVILVTITGYLIICNIFRISVTSDIKFYGLLKTIGATPRQLKRIIIHQALMLSCIGIPLGEIVGYLLAICVVPTVLTSTNEIYSSHYVYSASLYIFVISAIFSLLTVIISCQKSGRIVAKISPIEAVRYTEESTNNTLKRTHRKSTKFSLQSMAMANFTRSKSKSTLVVLSMSLGVVMLGLVYSFTNGFSMSKYLNAFSASDFLVASRGYFNHSTFGVPDGINDEFLPELERLTSDTKGGYVYGMQQVCFVDKEVLERPTHNNNMRSDVGVNYNIENSGKCSQFLMIEAFDTKLFDKLDVIDGDLSVLFDKESHAVAAVVDVDDYGIPYESNIKVGDTITASYGSEWNYIDKLTGKEADESTLAENIECVLIPGHDIEYKVAALVTVPHSLSFRYYISNSVSIVMTSDALLNDIEGLGLDNEVSRMLYVCDAPNKETEKQIESLLADFVSNDTLNLNYESKKKIEGQFTKFKNMFMIVGNTVCVIIGLIGILNFFNAILTGIISRNREHAMLQSVGMTGQQLQKMLMLEGLFYVLGSIIFSVVISVLVNPLIGSFMEKILWFYDYQFTIIPILIVTPIFIVLGLYIPAFVYDKVSTKSIVERLREIE